MTTQIGKETPWVGVRTGRGGTEYIKEDAEGNYIRVFRNIQGFNKFASGWTFGGMINGHYMENDNSARIATAKELKHRIDSQIHLWVH